MMEYLGINCPIEKEDCNGCAFDMIFEGSKKCMCPESLNPNLYCQFREDYIMSKKGNGVLTSEEFRRFLTTNL